MRSAVSSIDIALRATDTSGEITPPRTTSPSGGPRDASHNGKRSSNGTISTLPSGEYPAMARSTRPVTTSQLATLVHRVHKRTRPARPIAMKIFDDQAKKPSALDKMKNIYAASGPSLTFANPIHKAA